MIWKIVAKYMAARFSGFLVNARLTQSTCCINLFSRIYTWLNAGKYRREAHTQHTVVATTTTHNCVCVMCALNKRTADYWHNNSIFCVFDRYFVYANNWRIFAFRLLGVCGRVCMQYISTYVLYAFMNSLRRRQKPRQPFTSKAERRECWVSTKLAHNNSNLMFSVTFDFRKCIYHSFIANYNIFVCICISLWRRRCQRPTENIQMEWHRNIQLLLYDFCAQMVSHNHYCSLLSHRNRTDSKLEFRWSASECANEYWREFHTLSVRVRVLIITFLLCELCVLSVSRYWPVSIIIIIIRHTHAGESPHSWHATLAGWMYEKRNDAHQAKSKQWEEKKLANFQLLAGQLTLSWI